MGESGTVEGAYMVEYSLSGGVIDLIDRWSFMVEYSLSDREIDLTDRWSLMVEYSLSDGLTGLIDGWSFSGPSVASLLLEAAEIVE
jgi:hypothetical protein